MDQVLYNCKGGEDDKTQKLNDYFSKYHDKCNSVDKYNNYHYEYDDSSLSNSNYCKHSDDINPDYNDHPELVDEIVYILEATPPWKQGPRNLGTNLSVKQNLFSDRPVSAFDHFSFVDDQVVLDEVKTTWNVIGQFRDVMRWNVVPIKKFQNFCCIFGSRFSLLIRSFHQITKKYQNPLQTRTAAKIRQQQQTTANFHIKKTKKK